MVARWPRSRLVAGEPGLPPAEQSGMPAPKAATGRPKAH